MNKFFLSTLLVAASYSVDASTAGLRAVAPDNEEKIELHGGRYFAEEKIERHEGRNLQVGDTILKALVDQFTPLISTYLTGELALYDPLESTETTTIDLGNSTFGDTCPESSANLTYGVGSVKGISNLAVSSIDMVPGSDEVTVSFLGLNGATWGADWEFKFKWPMVTAEGELTLDANLCGFPVSQTVTGLATVKDTDATAIVSIVGKTDNAFQFRPTSEVSDIIINSVELSVGNVTADFGIQGSVIQNIKVEESLQKQVLTSFANDIEPFIVNVANAYLETNAPYSLAEDTLGGNGGVVTSKQMIGLGSP